MKKYFLLLALLSLLCTGCKTTQIEFSIISNKPLPVNESLGVKVKGVKHVYFIMSQKKAFRLAFEDALKQAGEGYDIVVNGKCITNPTFFYTDYIVEGTAMKSADMMKKMGKTGYINWAEQQQIMNVKSNFSEN